MDFAIAHEAALRLGSFLLIFAAMAAWELVAPRRHLTFSRRTRWPHNLAILLIDVAVLRILVPGVAISVAMVGEANESGLFNSAHVPPWLGIPLAVLLLDLAIYFQHVTFHAVPALWRLHRVHHSDQDFDITTGTRFHPIEILISTAIKCAAIAAIGAPALAVLAFELLLNGTAMFNHSNARLPPAVDRVLRLFVVTPDMHRVHHSVLHNESSSNFGFNTPWWDRMFGTYLSQPSMGHEAMTVGVDAFRTPEDQRVDRLLIQPLLDTPGGYPINRRGVMRVP